MCIHVSAGWVWDWCRDGRVSVSLHTHVNNTFSSTACNVNFPVPDYTRMSNDSI